MLGLPIGIFSFDLGPFRRSAARTRTTRFQITRKECRQMEAMPIFKFEFGPFYKGQGQGHAHLDFYIL